MIIAAKIIATYATYGMIPAVIPPLSLDIPLPTERTPVQRATDLKYLQELAARFDYAFYVTPGPAPGMNTAYWGPKVRIGLPQKALSVDMGAMTNVDSINFQNNATNATTVSGNVQDRDSNQATTIQTNTSTRPPLAAEPALNQPDVARQVRFNPDGGLNATQAMSQAQAITDASTDTVSADGELNAARYGDILQARGLVGLRGVGYSYDGLYYVKKVTHKIKRGEYKQSFSLTREGLGATVPMVRP
jgi:phage protein D